MPRRQSRDEDLTLQLTEQFEHVARYLREWNDTQFKKDLQKAMRNTAKPVVNEIKTRIRNMEVTGTRGGGRQQRVTRAGRPRGLRQSVASGVRFVSRFNGTNPSARFMLDASRLPADQRNLPRALNNPNGWRHPVFGDTSHWVQQRGQPYWESTIEPHREDFKSALNAELIILLMGIEHME
jgi:hypothetical protein